MGGNGERARFVDQLMRLQRALSAGRHVSDSGKAIRRFPIKAKGEFQRRLIASQPHRASRSEERAPSFRTRIFSRPQQSKIKLVGKAVLSLPPKLLKIQYALVVHLSPKAHLPLRAVALIFL
jgi:hypothetical protein